MPTLSIIIPAYNEEDIIADIVSRTISACSTLSTGVPGFDGFEVIVVDDGSRDKTASTVIGIPGAKLVSHPKNRGYGAALKTGFEKASGGYIGFLDADGTYPPESLPDLFRTALRSGADMVVGSRMAGERSGMPLFRKLGNMTYALLLSWIANARISDTASGMRIFKRDLLDRLRPLPDGLDLTPALSTIALYEGLKVIETPIPYGKRVGRSKLNIFTDGPRFLSTILGLAETYNPLKLFGAIGMALLGIAFFLGIGPVFHYLRYRTVPFTEFYRLLTIIVLSVTGLNAMTFGIAVNHVIASVRIAPEANHWLSRMIDPKKFSRLGPLGLVLVVSAIVLNGQAIYNYVVTSRVGVHWSYVLTGAFLFLTGAHLLMISRLVKIFDLLAEHKSQSAMDRSAENRRGKLNSRE